MRLKRYSSDVSAKSRQVIENIINVKRKSSWNLQDIVNGILYVSKNGCVWRDLPGEFPPWERVYWYYSKWVKKGTWRSINQCLIVDNGQKSGKNATASVMSS